eukprot:2119618-Prymnesium_polylepis.1
MSPLAAPPRPRAAPPLGPSPTRAPALEPPVRPPLPAGPPRACHRKRPYRRRTPSRARPQPC